MVFDSHGFTIGNHLVDDAITTMPWHVHIVQFTQLGDAHTSRPTDTRTYFTKPPTALDGHGGQILQPTDSPEVQRVALGFDERVPEQFKANLRLAKGGKA